MINRSGIEVAMDTEANQDLVLVVQEFWNALVGGCRESTGTSEQTIRRTRALNLQGRDVDTHIEFLCHVPLSARANEPPVPVVIATQSCNRVGAKYVSNPPIEVGGIALQGAQNVIGCVVVANRVPATIEGCPPP